MIRLSLTDRALKVAEDRYLELSVLAEQAYLAYQEELAGSSDPRRERVLQRRAEELNQAEGEAIERVLRVYERRLRLRTRRELRRS